VHYLKASFINSVIVGDYVVLPIRYLQSCFIITYIHFKIMYIRLPAKSCAEFGKDVKGVAIGVRCVFIWCCRIYLKHLQCKSLFLVDL
jgi:hypothetical protein